VAGVLAQALPGTLAGVFVVRVYIATIMCKRACLRSVPCSGMHLAGCCPHAFEPHVAPADGPGVHSVSCRVKITGAHTVLFAFCDKNVLAVITVSRVPVLTIGGKLLVASPLLLQVRSRNILLCASVVYCVAKAHGPVAICVRPHLEPTGSLTVSGRAENPSAWAALAPQQHQSMIGPHA
jgi:hypothetical protein